jgi:hypothetical protein
VYKDQLKLTKPEEAKQEILKNNGKDMRASENKVCHEYKKFGGGGVLSISNKFEDFNKK